jgi:hypothetical protein
LIEGICIMTLILISIAAFYISGFAFVMHAHKHLMPNVEHRLALVRSLVWPWFFLTGKPKGVKAQMD